MNRNAVAWAAMIVSGAALVSSSGIMRTAPATPQISEESLKYAKGLSDSFVNVAEFVKPSVVSIQTQRRIGRGANPGQRPNRGNGNAVPKNLDPESIQEMLRRFLPEDGQFQVEPQQFGGGVAQGTGSGVVFDAKGHILTNNHVVQNAEKIVVTFHDGEEANAKLIGTDPKSDIAVIKVDLTNYRPAERGKSDRLKVGEWVVAVGSPFGFEQSVTAGIVSALSRGEAGIIGPGAYEDFIQTDAAINPGNSGGPLVDLNGRVIGINSAIATANRSNSGVGFAIPISMAEHIADRLIKDGKVNRAAIGISLQPLTPALAKQFGLGAKEKGVLVERIIDGSPAQKAGLMSGDVILSFDDHVATNVPSFRNLVSTSEMGKSHTLTYMRNKEKRTTEINLAPSDKLLAQFDEPAKAEVKKEEKPKDEPKVELKGFGIVVQDLTPELAGSFGLDKSLKGALVSKVEEGSPAEANGVRPGLVVTGVVQSGKVAPVTSAKQFLEMTDKSDEITIHVEAPQVGRFVRLVRSK